MKKLLSIFVSLLIIIVIYIKIDLSHLATIFTDCNGWLMALGLAIILLTTLLSAWRLRILIPSETKPGIIEAVRLILYGNVLNLILPSKMGDIIKSYFIQQRGHLKGELALSLVVFEKACDVLALLAWGAFGLSFFPPWRNWLILSLTGIISLCFIIGVSFIWSKSLSELFFRISLSILPQKIRPKIKNLHNAWNEMHTYFWENLTRLGYITGLSLLIWFVHLFQIWIFILALNANITLAKSLGVTTLAILSGFLPFTFAGIGTRDAAFIFFYRPYFNTTTAAAVGIMATSRYLIAAIAGLPLFYRNIATYDKQSETV